MTQPLNEISEWLDGPMLYHWLREHDVVPGSDYERDTLYRWRLGRAAHIDLVDRILTRNGFSFFDLPEHIWLPSRIRKNEK